MLVDNLIRESGELRVALIVFALAIPIELLLGTRHQVAWSERLGNVGAMLVHFIVGGSLLLLLFDHPFGSRLLEYPDEPRFALLGNSLIYAFAAVFLVDAIYYVYHRLQHAVPLLWHIHKLHHTDPAMNITTAKRTHFLERPIQFFVLIAPVLWLLGFNAEGVVYVGLAGPFFLYFAHLDARLPLGPLTPIVVGPHYHRVHHSKQRGNQNSNFAQAFPLFDILGGTYHRPDDDEYDATGVEECKSAGERWRPIIW